MNPLFMFVYIENEAPLVNKHSRQKDEMHWSFANVDTFCVKAIQNIQKRVKILCAEICP